MEMTKRLRSLGGFTAFLLIAALALPGSASAVTPLRVWMPLQGVGPGWSGGMLQPLVDGTIDEVEYANGIKIDLNDFTDTAPNGNGRLYAAMAGNFAFTGRACLKPDGTGCNGSTLFLGLQVHAGDDVIGNENGTVVIYLDASRQKSLDLQSCKDASNFPTRRPAAEDRKIVISYTSALNQAQPTLSLREYKGNCQGWVDITPPGSDPMLEAWNYSVKAVETAGHPNVLTFEIAITAQPRSAPLFSSQIVNDRLFGLGVLHSARTRHPYGSFGHFPSVFNQKPGDLDTFSWATMDLGEPKRIDLAMTAYNVGQLQIAGDGGQGEAMDFAKLTFRNDFVCLVEEMNSSERNEVVKAINTLRQGEGLEPMTPVYPGNGDAPNNLLLVAGPVIDSDFVLYGDLPEVSAYCADEFDLNPFGGGECLGDGAGYKGIVWARVGVKKSKAVKGGKPETWFGDQFVDVFCTHTQADYTYDGEFANEQWCYDTIGSAAVGKNCVQSPAAPPDNPWRVNIREEQWKALQSWSHQKRAGGNGSPNGLDRPAFVLGDFNQIGPKAVSFGHPVEDVEDWVSATSNQGGFGEPYKAMRQELGTWPLSKFDQASGWNWDLYDLMARDANGSWIGNGTESAIPATNADNCITGSQFAGYNTIDQLPKEARLDYILVLPSEGGIPFYGLTGPTDNPAEPVVTISANAGSWTDGLGCASDHAQVSARFGLVQAAVKANYNPNKQHRVTYRVSHLWDFNDADSGDTDWYVNFNQFEMERLDAANAPLELRQKSFSDDSTPDGVAVPVKWSDALTLSTGEKARMGVWVWDSDWPSADDVYDGTSFGSGNLGPHFEFDSAFPGTFKVIADLFNAAGSILGTADVSAVDPDGSCAHGCLGVKTEGNGDGAAPDENVRVTQSIQIEEIH